VSAGSAGAALRTRKPCSQNAFRLCGKGATTCAWPFGQGRFEAQAVAFVFGQFIFAPIEYRPVGRIFPFSISVESGLTPDHPFDIRSRRRGHLCGLFDYEVRQMATGTVKWFNTTKGYGFIQPDDGGADVFVHISAVERSGLGSVREGQKLSYELEKDRKSGKFAAGDLKAL
jgi:CspA family cold shock protein